MIVVQVETRLDHVFRISDRVEDEACLGCKQSVCVPGGVRSGTVFGSHQL